MFFGYYSRIASEQKPTENQAHDVTGFIPRLADVGIEKMESHRYQQMASIPSEKFIPK